jgi:hypothetical protein
MFAALCMLLLVGGLMGLLMLNTSMAEGSFTLHRLQATSGELTDTEEALTAAIDAQRSPANLAARAAKMGMVPADSAAFLRLTDGAVLGVAKPAQKRPGFTVVTAAEAQAPKAKTAAPADGPTTTVTRKGDVTTTTVVVTKPDGALVTTTTSVNAKTKATTSTTTSVAPPAATAQTPAGQAPASPKPAQPGAKPVQPAPAR